MAPLNVDNAKMKTLYNLHTLRCVKEWDQILTQSLSHWELSMPTHKKKNWQDAKWFYHLNIAEIRCGPEIGGNEHSVNK